MESSQPMVEPRHCNRCRQPLVHRSCQLVVPLDVREECLSLCLSEEWDSMPSQRLCEPGDRQSRERRVCGLTRCGRGGRGELRSGMTVSVDCPILLCVPPAVLPRMAASERGGRCFRHRENEAEDRPGGGVVGEGGE